MTISKRIGNRFLIFSEECLPHCIVCDLDSIRPEVQEYFTVRHVKILPRDDQETTDLEKSLYVGLEKIAEVSSNSSNSCYGDRRSYAILLLGASGGRIEHTFAAYSQVYKYINNYFNEFERVEIFLLSKSSVSVYLKEGMNRIISSQIYQNKDKGYSIIPIFGKVGVLVNEVEEGYTFSKHIMLIYLDQYLKFGENILLKKKQKSNTILINLEMEKDCPTAVLYSFSTKYLK
jgi:thiamine pyrophosphokinase